MSSEECFLKVRCPTTSSNGSVPRISDNSPASANRILPLAVSRRPGS